MDNRFKFRAWDKKHNCYDDDISPCYFDVDGFVVEQCTGLKDKNGNLIYEGDIIQCYDTRFEVYYDELKCGLLLKCLESNGNKTDIPFYQIDHIYTFEDLIGFEDWEQFLNRVNLEVIGNIYENKGE